MFHGTEIGRQKCSVIFNIITKVLIVLLSLVIRDPDGYIYLRERDGCILAGGFEPVAKPVYEEESKYLLVTSLRSLESLAFDHELQQCCLRWSLCL